MMMARTNGLVVHLFLFCSSWEHNGLEVSKSLRQLVNGLEYTPSCSPRYQHSLIDCLAHTCLRPMSP